jgi:outer membrane protein, multidrug efflux system
VKKAIPFLFLTLVTCGCTVGPNYKRPKVDVPVTYRGAAEQNATQPQAPSSQAAQPAEQSLGDQKWWEVFQDQQLQELIRAALKQNYDVRIAAARIMEARAQLGITRADQLPTLGVGAAALNDRFPRNKVVPENETNFNAVSSSFAWDLDFWGKYRRATEETWTRIPGSTRRRRTHF